MAAAVKCVHRGCGKTYTDEDEACIYHPGPPEFHEGTKGWKCCKPRVLTFDEFLAIPPCTTGKHSPVDDTPQAEDKAPPGKSDSPAADANTKDALSTSPPARQPRSAPTQTRQATPAPTEESDSDEPDAPVPKDTTCKRRGCGASSSGTTGAVQTCTYHKGHPVFHEGSKGWTCCRRRVLEFDEFMRIPGCAMRERHCFVGKPKARRRGEGEGELERLASVRHDFYQTGSTLHVSLYLKKIDGAASSVGFAASGTALELDLRTLDGRRYEAVVPLYGRIDPGGSAFRVLGTKLDLTLAKADGAGWPVLTADERPTGEIIQTGSAGRA